MVQCRRQVLRSIPAVALGTLAGCSTGGGPTYSLFVQRRGPAPFVAFQWEPMYNSFEEVQQDRIDRLRTAGSVTTRGWRLHRPLSMPDRAEGIAPAFVRIDDQYHRLVLDERTDTERDRWVFWLDLLDEPPDDPDDVITEPPTALSTADRQIVERAIGDVAQRELVRDLDDVAPERRGIVFRRYDTDESALIPEPPFSHYKHAVDGREPQYFRARSDQFTIEETDYTYTHEQVASTRSELETYVETEVIAFDTADADFDQETSEVLQSAIETLVYEESDPAGGFRRLLDELGYGTPEQRDDDYGPSSFRHEGMYYKTTLSVRGEDFPNPDTESLPGLETAEPAE